MQSVPGAFAVLRRAGRGLPAPYLAGSLHSLSAPEVFHFLSAALKTGTLLLSFGGGGHDDPLPDVPAGLRRKTVSFRDGQVIFASSSERADRLGAVLWRNGLVPAAELARCGRLVQSARPLGQVLVEEGSSTPASSTAPWGSRCGTSCSARFSTRTGSSSSWKGARTSGTPSAFPSERASCFSRGCGGARRWMGSRRDCPIARPLPCGPPEAPEHPTRRGGACSTSSTACAPSVAPSTTPG